jgi:hypothetical protein
MLAINIADWVGNLDTLLEPPAWLSHPFIMIALLGGGLLWFYYAMRPSETTPPTIYLPDGSVSMSSTKSGRRNPWRLVLGSIVFGLVILGPAVLLGLYLRRTNGATGQIQVRTNASQNEQPTLNSSFSAEIVLMEPKAENGYAQTGFKWLPNQNLSLNIIRPPAFRVKNLSGIAATEIQLTWRIADAPPIRAVFLNSEHFKRYHAEIESGFAPFNLKHEDGRGVGMTALDEETTQISYLLAAEEDAILPPSIATSYGLRLVATSIRPGPLNQPSKGGGMIKIAGPLIDLTVTYRIAGRTHMKRYRLESSVVVLSDGVFSHDIEDPHDKEPEQHWSMEPRYWSKDNFRGLAHFSVLAKNE